MTWYHRFLHWLARLARVDAVSVGLPNDGLLRVTGGSHLDKSWDELSQEFAGALEAWRKSPLARRLVGLVTAYCVGPGIRLASDYAPLARFLERFCAHPQNRLDLRQVSWCDELSRAGELFIVLHTNPADGMSYVRAIPASSIDRIEWRPGDYEAELRYHERVGLDDPDYPEGRWWNSTLGERGDDGRRTTDDEQGTRGEGRGTFLRQATRVSAEGEPGEGRILEPVVLHFAVNRPLGCLRGESDLAPVLPWLRRYSRWLEDRVRLNAAVRAFLWVVKVPGALVPRKQAEYARPPEPGSVLVVDRQSEDWQAVAPDLSANDAQADGRAIRWMICAGGPGIGLVDLGEAETSNLATAAAMGEQRWRFMRQRQAYFGHILASIAVEAYNRAVCSGKVRGKPQEITAINVGLPDISSTDNASLGQAAADMARSLATLSALGIEGNAYRRLALRTVMRFAGETLSEAELARILEAAAADSVV